MKGAVAAIALGLAACPALGQSEPYFRTFSGQQGLPTDVSADGAVMLQWYDYGDPNDPWAPWAMRAGIVRADGSVRSLDVSSEFDRVAALSPDGLRVEGAYALDWSNPQTAWWSTPGSGGRANTYGIPGEISSASDAGLLAGFSAIDHRAWLWDRATQPAPVQIEIPPGIAVSLEPILSNSGRFLVVATQNPPQFLRYDRRAGGPPQSLTALHNETPAWITDSGVVVGNSLEALRTGAIMWTRAGIRRALPIPAGFGSARALSVSEDGRIIVGTTYDGRGNFLGLLWIDGVLRDPASYFAASGAPVAPDGMTIQQLGVVSRDGLSFGGTAGVSWDARTTFMARIHRPAADVNLDAFVDFFDYLAFIDCFEGSSNCLTEDPAVISDFNRDGFTDFFDYGEFVAAFEG